MSKVTLSANFSCRVNISYYSQALGVSIRGWIVDSRVLTSANPLPIMTFPSSEEHCAKEQRVSRVRSAHPRAFGRLYQPPLRHGDNCPGGTDATAGDGRASIANFILTRETIEARA